MLDNAFLVVRLPLRAQMSEDEISAIHRRLDQQDRVLQLVPAIHAALVGDPALGNPGLVARVKASEEKNAKLEERQNDQGRTMMKWAGIATGASLALSAFKEKFFG